LGNTQTDTQRKLIEESINGSLKAQHQLYNKFAGAMFYTCNIFMRNREEAEDMLQEAFSQAFMTLENFRFEASFGTWLKRIVVNKCINEIKRKKTDLHLSENIEDFEEIQDEDLPEQLNINHVKEAMKSLPEGGRIIFQLYLLEGYDHREIAEILGVSESNSKSQYMRAKNKVKEILKDRRYETR